MRSKGGHIVIGGLGLAIAVLSYLLVTVYRQENSNTATIRQLTNAVAAAQQDAREARLLVRELQAQVRECKRHPHRCGPPLTAPRPIVRTQPGTTTPPTGSPSDDEPTATPTAEPRPTRPPRPSPSPRPTPSPSPTCLVTVSRLCIHPGSPRTG